MGELRFNYNSEPDGVKYAVDGENSSLTLLHEYLEGQNQTKNDSFTVVAKLKTLIYQAPRYNL